MVPHEKMSLIAGVLEAFEVFLGEYHLHFLEPVIAFMIFAGAIGELNAWVIGPVLGLYATSEHGDLPYFFHKVNTRGVPVHLLIFQGIIVTIATILFMNMPSASSAFWLLSAMAIQLYLIMYFFLFITLIRLRYTHDHVER